MRATDANGCFAERPYTMTINAAVPTLPQYFVILLSLALVTAGQRQVRSYDPTGRISRGC